MPSVVYMVDKQKMDLKNVSSHKLKVPSVSTPALQIMSSEVQDVPGIIASKAGLKYAGADVDAMRAVSKAYENRSLSEFQSTLQSYSVQLQEDSVVHGHLTALYDMMLEQNLIRYVALAIIRLVLLE